MLDYAAQMVRKYVLQRPTGVQTCQITGGGCQVNPATGNLILQYRLPAGGAFDPMSVLTYNNLSNQPNDFGIGWNTLLQPRILELSANVAVIVKGSGTTWTYTNPNAEGLYTPPPGARDELVKDFVLGTWTETQPNGLKYHYDANGVLVNLENRGGQIWSLLYDDADRLSSIADPFGELTTYSYDENGKIGSSD